MNGTTVLRYALGALGLVLIGVGAGQLALVPEAGAVALWLAGALVLHDAVIAPLVLAAGLLVAAAPARGMLRGALVTGGALVLITLPLLVRPGAPPNPSALPLPYVRNLLLVLAAVALAALLLTAVGAWRRRARERGEERQERGKGDDGGGERDKRDEGDEGDEGGERGEDDGG
ncbi:hypothetical protein [Streptomyces purpureus]|uniref:hypothetical protein n=1 Tax=Streptomyces purpureus TaxID=1951 RepID=UPI00037B1268|nr:hypothetical protein [Streptomyces purpureus]